jgi:hypothetical protein
MTGPLGRYKGNPRDSAAFDLAQGILPGSDDDTVFRRATIPLVQAVADLAAQATGVAIGARIYLRKGDVVTNITFVSGATAAVTPTNWGFALYDSADALLAQSADQLTAAWAASSPKTLALATAQTITKDGWYTVAQWMAAATLPTLAGAAPLVGVQGSVAAPYTGAKALGRTFGTGLTGTAPATIVTPATVAKVPLAIVS